MNRIIYLHVMFLTFCWKEEHVIDEVIWKEVVCHVDGRLVEALEHFELISFSFIRKALELVVAASTSSERDRKIKVRIKFDSSHVC